MAAGVVFQDAGAEYRESKQVGRKGCPPFCLSWCLGSSRKEGARGLGQLRRAPLASTSSRLDVDVISYAA